MEFYVTKQKDLKNEHSSGSSLNKTPNRYGLEKYEFMLY